jgi:hypothetical protein
MMNLRKVDGIQCFKMQYSQQYSAKKVYKRVKKLTYKREEFLCHIYICRLQYYWLMTISDSKILLNENPRKKEGRNIMMYYAKL